MPEIEELHLAGSPPTVASVAGSADDEEVPSAGGAAGNPRSALLHNVLATIIIGAVIAGVVWFIERPAGAATSQSLTLTARATGPAPTVGKEAPDFRLLGLDGQPVQLSDYRGRPVWVTFWASWCPPCRAENPDIQAAYEQYRDAGLVILAIDIGEDPGTVGAYVERTGLTFTIALDRDTEVAAAYRIAGIPTHYFIDADGILRDWRIGSMGKKAIERKVQAIMSPASVAAKGR